MKEIKTAIIPVAGLSTRFLPLSKVVPKELWPLVDRPVIQYIIAEAKNSGIEKIIFVLSPKNKALLDYLKSSPQVEKILKERKKTNILAELKKLEEFLRELSFSYVVQKKAMGDGNAVLQAAKLVREEPVACLFADDIVESKTPSLLQLNKVFKTCQKPVIALYRMPPERVSNYGIAAVEKIAHRLFKIKKIVEKPEPAKAPSDLAIVGKYILTPEVFDYLKKAKPNANREVILAEVFEAMLKDGKLIYGCEIEGKWLECGTKSSWLKSNLYLALKHPQYGEELKKFLKNI